MTYVFDFASLEFMLGVLLYLFHIIEITQLLYQRLKMLSLLVVHDETRNAVVVIYEPAYLVGQVTVGTLHTNEDLRLSLGMTLEVLSIFFTHGDVYLVRVDVSRNLTELTLDLLLSGIIWHIKDAV